MQAFTIRYAVMTYNEGRQQGEQERETIIRAEDAKSAQDQFWAIYRKHSPSIAREARVISVA